MCFAWIMPACSAEKMFYDAATCSQSPSTAFICCSRWRTPLWRRMWVSHLGMPNWCSTNWWTFNRTGMDAGDWKQPNRGDCNYFLGWWWYNTFLLNRIPLCRRPLWDAATRIAKTNMWRSLEPTKSSSRQRALLIMWWLCNQRKVL